MKDNEKWFIAIGFIIVALIESWMGRTLWGKNGPGIWTWQIDGSETSSFLFDPYTLAHFNEGMVLWILIVLYDAHSTHASPIRYPTTDHISHLDTSPIRYPSTKQISHVDKTWNSPMHHLWIAMIIQFILELYENSNSTISSYRLIYTNYQGDSIANSFTDSLATLVGFITAHTLFMHFHDQIICHMHIHGVLLIAIVSIIIESYMIETLHDSFFITVIQGIHPSSSLLNFQRQKHGDWNPWPDQYF
jgi:hypothetical protein